MGTDINKDSIVRQNTETLEQTIPAIEPLWPNQRHHQSRLLHHIHQSKPPVIYYWPFQGDASVVVYSNCQCSSAFYLSLTYCSIYLRQPCSHLLGKSCPLGISLMLFLFYCRFNCRCRIHIWCLGQDVEFDCIGSWSLPFYLLCLCIILFCTIYHFGTLIWGRENQVIWLLAC